LERETLTCPFCGAPHREVIPADTVQVKCRYCGGTILVPSSAPRCPNHPEVLAVGLCNNCGGSYCDSCLYLSNVKNATLYLCPNCFKNREAMGTTVTLILGSLVLLLGFFLVLIPTVEAAIRGFFCLLVGFAAISWGIYRRSHFPKGASLKERKETTLREIESRKSWGSQASEFELYQRLLSEGMRDYGPQFGWQMLERRIDSYVQSGMSRSEALRKLAEEKGY